MILSDQRAFPPATSPVFSSTCPRLIFNNSHAAFGSLSLSLTESLTAHHGSGVDCRTRQTAPCAPCRSSHFNEFRFGFGGTEDESAMDGNCVSFCQRNFNLRPAIPWERQARE